MLSATETGHGGYGGGGGGVGVRSVRVCRRETRLSERQ